MHALENGQDRHQPCGQRWLAGAIAVDRVKFVLEEAPVDGAGHFHQGVGGIDDLVEARSQQVLLAAVLALGGRIVPLPGGSGSSESNLAASRQS